MSAHTSLKVGGPAAAFVEPAALKDLTALTRWLHEQGHTCLVVGCGTNLLVTDRGLDGIVISLDGCLNRIVNDGRMDDRVGITAMAGVRLSRLCTLAVRKGFGGMNFALGIPGTVGGAIMMNAGTSYGWTADVLDAADFLLPTGEVQTLAKKELDFSYRALSWQTGHATFNMGRPVVIQGRFILHPEDPVRLRREADEILALRKKKQPTAKASAGCFFKNPAVGGAAGELIDRAGLKGARIGDAQVSTRHANFIINRGKATAADILKLAGHVRQTVREKFNIRLETEVQIVGN